MAKHEVLDAEGKPIDSNKDLSSFLQGIEASEVSAPAWETAVFEVDDPDLKGRTGKDAVALIQQRREEAEQARLRAQQLEQALISERNQRQTEETVRRVMAESQVRQNEEPKIDPRLAKVDELWFVDAPAARALLQQIEDERRSAALTDAEARAEQRIMQKLNARETHNAAQRAYETAVNALVSEGIPADAVNARMGPLLAEVTRPQSPFYQNGSLTNPNNIYHAFKFLVGMPQQAQQAPIVAPPGSNRPSPAAAAPRPSNANLSPEQRRDADQLAEAFGYDKQKFAERRARRNQGA